MTRTALYLDEVHFSLVWVGNIQKGLLSKLQNVS